MEFEETNDAVGNNFFCDHQFTSVFLLWFCFILLHFPVGGFHEFGADSKAFNLRFLRFEPKILTTGGFKVKKIHKQVSRFKQNPIQKTLIDGTPNQWMAPNPKHSVYE